MADFLARFLADPTVSTIITAALAGLIALWLLSAMWVHADAEHRTGSAAAALFATGWVLLSTPLMLPLALAAYAFVRPGEAIGERRIREITTAMVADSLAASSCDGCGSIVDAAWRRCPTCATWLAVPCAACGRWSDVALEVCPWCGEGQRQEPVVDEASDLGAGPSIAQPSRPAPAARAPVLPAAHIGSGVGRRELVDAAFGAEPTSRSDSRPGRAAGAGIGLRRRSPRFWQRRAPGAVARSLERGTGGRSGAASRS